MAASPRARWLCRVFQTTGALQVSNYGVPRVPNGGRRVRRTNVPSMSKAAATTKQAVSWSAACETEIEVPKLPKWTEGPAVATARTRRARAKRWCLGGGGAPSQARAESRLRHLGGREPRTNSRDTRVQNPRRIRTNSRHALVRAAEANAAYKVPRRTRTNSRQARVQAPETHACKLPRRTRKKQRRPCTNSRHACVPAAKTHG